jgi:hypothetical protein
MAENYATIPEFKEQMSEVPWDDSYETIIKAMLERASRQIDRLIKRWPGFFYAKTESTRYFTGRGDSELWISEAPLATAPTSVAVAESGVVDDSTDSGGDYTAWASNDYLLWPYNAVQHSEPFLRLDIDVLNGTKAIWYAYPKGIKIVGKFGFATTTPPDIKQATLVQCIRWFKRAQQAYADTGAILDLGQLRYVQKLDPDVENTIMNFMETIL